MPLLPASTGKRELWKNGLGSTLVVASDATTVGGDDWSWRLAIADIPSRCAFSNYVGIDRCIALLEGAGLAIERGDRRQDLPVVGSALAFAGEEEVVGDPTGDGVRDANLMLRRTHWRGEMQLVRSGAMPVDATLVVIHAANGAIEIASAHEPSIARIESGETLITHGAVEVRPLLGACAIICTMCPANSSLPSTSLVPLREALRVWAYIGVNSFGGPTAQIALMHRVIVDERKWLGEDRFLHALNFCMLLPGPEAMQLATYIGWLKSRTLGGLIAGCCFVLPGFLALLALSIAYTAWSDVTVVQGMLFGLKAAVLAIITHAILLCDEVAALRNNPKKFVADSCELNSMRQPTRLCGGRMQRKQPSNEERVILVECALCRSATSPEPPQRVNHHCRSMTWHQQRVE